MSARYSKGRRWADSSRPTMGLKERFCCAPGLSPEDHPKATNEKVKTKHLRAVMTHPLQGTCNGHLDSRNLTFRSHGVTVNDVTSASALVVPTQKRCIPARDAGVLRTAAASTSTTAARANRRNHTLSSRKPYTRDPHNQSGAQQVFL